MFADKGAELAAVVEIVFPGFQSGFSRGGSPRSANTFSIPRERISRKNVLISFGMQDARQVGEPGHVVFVLDVLDHIEGLVAARRRRRRCRR